MVLSWPQFFSASAKACARKVKGTSKKYTTCMKEKIKKGNWKGKNSKSKTKVVHTVRRR